MIIKVSEQALIAAVLVRSSINRVMKYIWSKEKIDRINEQQFCERKCEKSGCQKCILFYFMYFFRCCCVEIRILMSIINIGVNIVLESWFYFHSFIYKFFQHVFVNGCYFQFKLKRNQLPAHL